MYVLHQLHVVLPPKLEVKKNNRKKGAVQQHQWSFDV